jgi:phage-related protein
MKKAILIIAPCTVIMIIVVMLTGCVAPIIKKDAGPTTNREYNFTDFTSIEIGDAFKLEVIPADTFSISINANENTLDHIDVSKIGNKLKIDMDNLFFSFTRSPRVKITMPELRGLYLSGSSEGNVTGFKSSQDFDLTLSGASELNMDMETGDLVCEISGASEVIGYLKATSSDIVVSGASKIRVNGSSGDIKIGASGAS